MRIKYISKFKSFEKRVWKCFPLFAKTRKINISFFDVVFIDTICKIVQMKIDKKLVIIIGVVVIAVALYYYNRKPERMHMDGDDESFMTAGDLQSLGTIVPDGHAGQYELVPGTATGIYPSLDSALKATDFADLVDSGDQAIQVAVTENANRPLERLRDLSESMFPTIASKALPFSQAAAKPLTFSHAVNLPRVNLRGKLYEMNLSEAVRGTVAINYDPNVSVVAASQYRNEDVFNPGYMTGAFNSLHDKLTGGYKNLPMYISSGAGTASGVGGMGVEAIYDI